MHNKNTDVANFFWVGDLTNYELLSINSFLDNGFNVNFWTYSETLSDDSIKKIPKNISIRDANLLIKREMLFKFTQGRQKANMSSFSNIFRYELLKENYGWWFDTDCICLKNVKYFQDLANDKKFVIGREYKDYVGSSVMFFDDLYTLNLITDEVEKKIANNNYNFKWGEIGPDLITNVFHKNNLIQDTKHESYFFKVTAKKFHILFDSNREVAKFLQNDLKDSFVCHTWNEMFRKFLINKDLLPPKGSYLYNEMNKYGLIKKESKIYSKYLKLRFKPLIRQFVKLLSRIKVIITQFIKK